MRISDWSSDVCSSDLPARRGDAAGGVLRRAGTVPGGAVDDRGGAEAAGVAGLRPVSWRQPLRPGVRDVRGPGPGPAAGPARTAHGRPHPALSCPAGTSPPAGAVPTVQLLLFLES